MLHGDASHANSAYRCHPIRRARHKQGRTFTGLICIYYLPVFIRPVLLSRSENVAMCHEAVNVQTERGTFTLPLDSLHWPSHKLVWLCVSCGSVIPRVPRSKETKEMKDFPWTQAAHMTIETRYNNSAKQYNEVAGRRSCA